MVDQSIAEKQSQILDTISEQEAELFDQSEISDDMKSFSKINKYFPHSLIKLFYYYALSYELGDNNKKAELFTEIMNAYFGNKFLVLGTGTNRIAFRRGNFVYKIALDRRGFIDNFSELKRSPEAPNLLALTYECNGLIAVSEYVTLLDQDQFRINQSPILELLRELAKQYIFGDIGYTIKNYCNFGFRTNGNEQEIVVLDYAYMHPRFTNEDALICPQCGSEIRYNPNYTGFRCTNPNCNIEYSYLDIKRRLDTSYENLENVYMNNLNMIDLPDLENITFTLDDKDNDIFLGVADKGQKITRRRNKEEDESDTNLVNVQDLLNALDKKMQDEYQVYWEEIKQEDSKSNENV